MLLGIAHYCSVLPKKGHQRDTKMAKRQKNKQDKQTAPLKKHMNISYHTGRNSPWRFSVKIGGKRICKFFATEREAVAFKKTFERKTKEDGVNSLFFTQSERADYDSALKIATERGFRCVCDALRDKVVAQPPPTPNRGKSAAVSPIDAFNEYYDAKVKLGRRDATLRDIVKRVKAFCKASPPFDELTQGYVEEWCVSGNKAPRTCKNNFTTIVSFLRWAKRRGYHDLPLDFDQRAFLPKELKRAKPVFSVDDVRHILRTLLTNPMFTRFVPFYALQLFCGIRRAEAERMLWDWIDIEAQTITLPAQITKTGDEHVMRAPFLPDTVFAWLAPFVPTTHKGKILFPCANMRLRITNAIGKWEHNGMRHTFATMHVSLHGDPAKTAVLLRHRNQQRLWQSYLAKLAPESDAKEYFNLSPTNIHAR